MRGCGISNSELGVLTRVWTVDGAMRTGSTLRPSSCVVPAQPTTCPPNMIKGLHRKAFPLLRCCGAQPCFRYRFVLRLPLSLYYSIPLPLCLFVCPPCNLVHATSLSSYAPPRWWTSQHFPGCDVPAWMHDTALHTRAATYPEVLFACFII